MRAAGPGYRDFGTPGARLRRCAYERGMSVEALSEASGVPVRTLYDIFSGASGGRARTWARLCSALGVQMGEFFPLEGGGDGR